MLDDIAQAREIAESRSEQERAWRSARRAIATSRWKTCSIGWTRRARSQTLNIILRADVRGSIEAIEKELAKLEHPEVKIKLLQKSVGGITEADVTLADASDAIIIGFNVVPDEKARIMAEKTGVQIRRYDVIYKITDDLKLALEGMLKPEEREVEQGRALVQQVFKISRVGTIAGCRVLSGVVERNSRARIIRDSTIIGDYAIDTLRREKDDAKEVREGYECGIKLAGFNDIKEGDLLEVYKVEEIQRKFEARVQGADVEVEWKYEPVLRSSDCTLLPDPLHVVTSSSKSRRSYSRSGQHGHSRGPARSAGRRRDRDVCRGIARHAAGEGARFDHGRRSAAEIVPARTAELGRLLAEQDLGSHRHALHAAAAVRGGQRRQEIARHQPDASRTVAGYECVSGGDERRDDRDE